jgi:tetratricopeptide (TPR) repeat protein
MSLTQLACDNCGAVLDVDGTATTYACRYCRTSHERALTGAGQATPASLQIMAERAIGLGEYGRALQLAEQGLAIDPHHPGLLDVEGQARTCLELISLDALAQTEQALDGIHARGEADSYKIQAEHILFQLQANRKVYGSNLAFVAADPANVNLALKYIDRSLELFPDDPVYLNLKALLLWEGKGEKDSARALLQRAAQLNPRDINIQENLKTLQASACFIATAAYGTPFAGEIDVLRRWRDTSLQHSVAGRAFVATYYRLSPPIARYIEPRPTLRKCVRLLLAPLVRRLENT